MLDNELKKNNKKPNKVRNSESQTQNKILGLGNLDSVDLLHISEIMFIRAEGKYTEFYMSDGKKFVSSKNIGVYIAILDPKCFFRVHHSYCVNINFITKINKKDGLYCEIKHGLTVPISIRKTEEFNRFILLKVK